MKEGQRHCARLALSEGADVNAISSKGESALYLAVKHNHPECIELLIKAGTDIHCARLVQNAGSDVNQDPRECSHSALVAAVIERRFECCELLINCGANLEQVWSVFTPLTFATWKGMDDIVDLLIRAGADVKHSTTRGTPLLFASAAEDAARAGRKKYLPYKICAEMLIEAGANVNFVLKDGTTPLMACSKCYLSTWTKLLFGSRADVNATKLTGETALMYAAGSAHYESLQQLIKAGADVNAFDSQGLTSLMYCFDIAKHNSYFNIRKCCKTLIKAGANVKAINEAGKAALHYAAKNCRSACLRLLLTAGADVNRCCNAGNTPLTETANLSCTRVLLRAGAHVNIYNNNGYSALMSFLIKPGYLDEDAVLMLFAAGETDYKPASHHQNDVKIPTCLVQLSSVLNLMNLCRQEIRKYLLNNNSHSHLFVRIPLLDLPSLLESYLLFHVSLEETHRDSESSCQYVEIMK